MGDGRAVGTRREVEMAADRGALDQALRRFDDRRRAVVLERYLDPDLGHGASLVAIAVGERTGHEQDARLDRDSVVERGGIRAGNRVRDRLELRDPEMAAAIDGKREDFRPAQIVARDTPDD